MKRSRPVQHRRRLPSGKVVTVNKGVKKKVVRKRSDSRSVRVGESSSHPYIRNLQSEVDRLQDVLMTKNLSKTQINNNLERQNYLEKAIKLQTKKLTKKSYY